MNADTPAAFTDLDHEMLAIEADERTRRAAPEYSQRTRLMK